MLQAAAGARRRSDGGWQGGGMPASCQAGQHPGCCAHGYTPHLSTGLCC